ncbi:lipid IV(A) 3-deoxy-D-manno-octulosonic acid transferase [Vibrio sp. ZF57]|uniref:lipid IV(A) 3-deoxy-D-manno-octulosonic acid transferase n=1 Tax=Vibrio sp. ZF57 TaxID=1840084 RepID=UPI00080E8894|nr:lipid IV(A) 3-deoxy-D-manno-octulosonic acid transferase [Vibrio sp. ZF57]OCH52772.1 3-deoxy-D-manno-octulosonic acid transferase [Vibrio sp. ZF57]
MLIRAIYTLLLALAAPLLLFGLYKNKPNKPKFGKRWKEHFGVTPKLESGQKPIWIHAVSVGESIAAVPLIKALKAQSPSLSILVTTTTSTGAEQIAKLGNLVEHRYMPIDFDFAINAFIKVIQPSQMLIIETELWPNTLYCVNKSNIPVTVVNARLSEKSYKNYLKIRPLFTQISSNINTILCQANQDAERFEKLGVNPEKLVVTGSLKFDVHINNDIKEKGAQLRAMIGVNKPVWIAASTHNGEDDIVLSAHKKILELEKNAVLILVPRHPERFETVYQLAQNANFHVTRHSECKNKTVQETSIYLGDTMGEMLEFLSASDICFMGGSLVGDKVGGHNLLEPTATGIPSLIGPSYFNFTEITNALVNENITSIVNSDKEIAKSILNYWKSDPDRTKENALCFIKRNCGAVDNTIKYIIGK